MAKLGDLVVAIGANTRDLDKELGKSMRKIKNFGKSTKQLGKSLSTSLTAPLAALGGMAVKTAADFEFSMAKVAAVSGFTANEMQALEQQAKQLGGSTSKSASDVASLQLELAKLGNSAGEIQAMTESVLSLSIAFDTDLGQTASVVGATLNQFGLDASESGRVADNMATLFGSSALDLEKFDNAMRVVGPTANALGISLEDTGSALGILTNAGLDAGTAGTALTKAFTTLVQNGTPANEVLTKLTDGNLSVAEGFEVFGDRAGKIIPLLQGTTGELAALTQRQLENTGAAIEARKVLEDTAQGGFDALRSAVESAGITIGQALMPTVKKATQFITGIASALGNMNERTSNIIVTVAALAAAIGPVLVILPTLAQGFMMARTAMLALNTVMLANPFALVAAAIALVVTGIIAMTGEAEKATTAVDDLKKANEGLTKAEKERNIVEAMAKQKELVAQLKEERDEKQKLVDQGYGGKAIKDAREAGEAYSKATKELSNMSNELFMLDADGRMKELAQDTEDVATEAERVVQSFTLMGRAIDVAKEKQDKLRDAFEGVQEAIQPMRPKTEERGLMMADGRANVDLGVSTEGIDRTSDEALNALDMLEARSTAIAENIKGNLTNTFSNLFTGLMNGTQSFGDFMKQVLTDLLIQLASMAAAFAIISLLLPGSSVATGGFGAFMKGGLGIPQFAAGGIVSGPTLAMVGEYSGASTNPEVIAPLDKLQSMMGGAGGNVTVTGRISGRDILLSNERANFERNRSRGF